MKLSPFFSAVLAVSLLTACPLHKDESDKKKARGGRENPTDPVTDKKGEVSFQAFLTGLRKAVADRDMPTIASMMTSDFGYRWDTPPPGDNVFAYWDQHDVWPQLNAVVKKNWVAHDGFMVAPPDFASNPNYGGYRAGAKMVNGG